MHKSNQKFILIYALLIAGLGGYIYHLHRQKALWLGFAEQALRAHKETRDNLDRDNLYHFYEVDKKAMAFRTQHSIKALQQAKATRRLCAEFLAFTDRIRTKHWVVGSSNKAFAFKGLLGTQAEQDALVQRVNLLRDSFCIIAQDDTALVNKIKPQFYIVNDLMDTHRDDQKLLYLASLDMQVLIVAYELLYQLKAKTSQHSFWWVSDSFYFWPNLTLKQPCIKAGEPFEGIVSLEGYVVSADNVTYYCNDKRLPIKDGLGKIRLEINPETSKYVIQATAILALAFNRLINNYMFFLVISR